MQTWIPCLSSFHEVCLMRASLSRVPRCFPVVGSAFSPACVSLSLCFPVGEEPLRQDCCLFSLSLPVLQVSYTCTAAGLSRCSCDHDERGKRRGKEREVRMSLWGCVTRDRSNGSSWLPDACMHACSCFGRRLSNDEGLICSGQRGREGTAFVHCMEQVRFGDRIRERERRWRMQMRKRGRREEGEDSESQRRQEAMSKTRGRQDKTDNERGTASKEVTSRAEEARPHQQLW